MSKKKSKTELQNDVPEQAAEQNLSEQETDEITQADVEQIVDELAATPKQKRIWEVDFLRGFMILFVVWDHLMWDIRYLQPYNTDFFNALYNFAVTYDNGALRAATHDAFVTLFVFTSGISCSFTRNNGKRALKMISFALLFTAITYAAQSIVHEEIAIYFNVIHVLALSTALWTVIEWAWAKCSQNWQKNVFGAVMTVLIVTSLVVGSAANTKMGAWQSTNPMFFFLANHKEPNVISTGGDYLPFLPDFGWFLIGAFLGKFIYKEKKTLFPSVNTKWVSPVTFCGRYSIWIYFGSQLFLYALFYLLSVVANVL